VAILPRKFVRFLDGRAGAQFTVAFLPGQLGAYLGTLETNVNLKLDYAQKLVHKHKINFAGFEEIQNAIDKGFCLRDNPNHLSFLYVKEPVRPEIYFLLLKTNALKNELWLVTFHRLKKKQFERKLRESELIREHADDSFMG